MLDALVSKSLVRRVAGDRYQIHELLRQYAEERLREDADEAALAAAAAGQFYTVFLCCFFPHTAGQGITHQVQVPIASEIENIRAAWGDILAQSDGEALRRVVHIIQYVCFVRGPYQEGAALIEQALARLLARPSTTERRVAIADCRNILGWFRRREERINEARQFFADSMAIVSDLALPRPTGYSTEPLIGLGTVALIEGDYREAVRLGRAALDRAEAEGHRGNERDGLHLLVSAALAQGRYRLAQNCARNMYAIAQALGNRWFLAACHIALGHIASGLGAYAEARRHYEAAYLLREEFADPEGMAVALAAQGEAALLEGKPAEARQLYERSLAIYRYLGDQSGLAVALDGLGQAQVALRMYALAHGTLVQALRIALAMTFTPLRLTVLLSVAELLLATGNQDQSLTFIRLVARHPATAREANRRAQALLLNSAATPEPPELVPDQHQDLFTILAAALQALGAWPDFPLQTFSEQCA